MQAGRPGLHTHHDLLDLHQQQGVLPRGNIRMGRAEDQVLSARADGVGRWGQLYLSGRSKGRFEGCQQVRCCVREWDDLGRNKVVRLLRLACFHSLVGLIDQLPL